MRKLLLLGLGLLVGCMSPNVDSVGRIVGNGVWRVVDSTNNVVCYVSSEGGLFCFRGMR